MVNQLRPTIEVGSTEIKSEKSDQASREITNALLQKESLRESIESQHSKKISALNEALSSLDSRTVGTHKIKYRGHNVEVHIREDGAYTAEVILENNKRKPFEEIV